MDIENINSAVEKPNYPRENLQERIVHIGFGAFHRGHQAYVLDQLLQLEESDWGICAITLMGSSAEMVDSFKEQGHLFSVVERFNDQKRATLVGSVINVVQRHKEGSAAVIQKLSEPQVSIVSLTVTEKGYCADAKGELDITNQSIQHDLKNLSEPVSVPGILYAALKNRYENNLSALSCLSCDNIAENSLVLRNVLMGFTQIVDPDFVPYILQEVKFPCSMVDRIVPAVTDEVLNSIEQTIGERDVCGIETEPFLQWVIEDDFVGSKPNWNKVSGVTLVKNVVPYEEMKLRMLNGSHSFLAYLGSLSGYEYVSDCMQDDIFKQTLIRLMLSEQAKTLSVEGIDLEEYADQLIQRFGNHALKHRVLQIAMDGSQKIPQRFLASLVWHLQNNQQAPLITLGLAGWLYFIHKNHERLQDPYQPKINTIAKYVATDEQFIHEILALEIFPKELQEDRHLAQQLLALYTSIAENGAQKTVKHILNQHYGVVGA